MKKIKITTSLLIVFSFVYIEAQTNKPKFPIDSLTGKIVFSEVVDVDSLATSKKLFSIAREWFAKSYNSSTNVIQMEDKENGVLIGKAAMEVFFNGAFKSRFSGGYIDYTISLYFKKGKYKYEITDFYHRGTIVGGSKTPDGGPCENLLHKKKGFWGNPYRKTYLLYLIQMDTQIKYLIDDLNSTMKMKVLQNKNDKW